MIVSKMQNYVGSAAKQVAGKLGSSVLGAINCDQGVLNSVLGKVDYLHQAIDRATAFINMFSLLNNEIPTETSLKVTLTTKLVNDVSYAKREIEDGLDFIRENYGDKFTMTDSSGLMYNLYLQEDEWIEDGKHVKSLLKTSMRRSIDDCILYYEDGVFKFNQILRSANFSLPEFGQVQPNILSNLGLYLSNMGQNFDGTFSSLAGDGTIVDRFTSLGATGSTIYELSSSLITFSTYYRGKVKLFWDVLRDFIQSSEINATLLEVIQAISYGVSGVQAYISSVAARLNNAMSAIKKFFIDLSNAFSQGGFKGVVYFVYNFFRDGASMIDKDGLLSFTDNSLLVPRQYIAGMVPAIVTAVTSLISVIAGIINPVLGVVVGAAGALLYGVFKSISYDKDATLCGIQTSDKVLVPAFPIACFQDTFTPNPQLLNLLNDYPIMLFEVPGGYVVIGPGSYDADKHITSARVEFHASSVQKLPMDYYDPLLNNRCTSEFQDVTHPQYIVDINVLISKNWRDKIVRDWAKGDYVIDIQNASNDRVTGRDDYFITQLLMINTFTFLYWILSAIKEDNFLYIGGYTVRQTALPVDQYHPYNDIVDFHCSYDENIEKLLILTAPFVVCKREVILDNYTPQFRAVSAASWAEITDKFKNWCVNNVNVSLYPLVIFGNDGSTNYYGDPIIPSNTFDWAIVTPKYDASTFLTWIIIANIVVAVTAVVAVIATFKIKKAIQNKRAEMNKMVDKAWSDYTKGDITYDQYRKTVKKANRWQTIIGGTRYDYENYWNGDQSADDANDTESPDPESLNSVSNVCSDLINKIYSPEDNKSTDIGQLSIEDIKTLISSF